MQEITAAFSRYRLQGTQEKRQMLVRERMEAARSCSVNYEPFH